MKYIVILGDGWADFPDESGNTPLSLAQKPNIDKIAKISRCGLCKTVPDGMKPGSDVANMSVMGYDPKTYYTGRSPLEASSMGIELGNNDVTYRCNLVTLGGDGDYENLTMDDYSAGEISSEEASELIAEVASKVGLPNGWELHAGVSYRHCLVCRDAQTGAVLTPPHDISGKKITDYLPKGVNGEKLLDFMKASRKVLLHSAVNAKRLEEGKNPATSCWLWGEGTRPAFASFFDKWNKTGAVISAVDLVKGIGKVADMDVIEVKGACGTLKTNFDGKARACLEAIKTHDFVYVHMEAPDECGHQGDKAGKIKSIELIDEKVVRPVFDEMSKRGEPFKLLIMPDHPTPLAVRTHVSDPVPFVLYDSTEKINGVSTYNEDSVKATKEYFESGVSLFGEFIK